LPGTYRATHHSPHSSARQLSVKIKPSGWTKMLSYPCVKPCHGCILFFVTGEWSRSRRCLHYLTKPKLHADLLRKGLDVRVQSWTQPRTGASSCHIILQNEKQRELNARNVRSSPFSFIRMLLANIPAMLRGSDYSRSFYILPTYISTMIPVTDKTTSSYRKSEGFEIELPPLPCPC
jgi:hypothetical protein